MLPRPRLVQPPPRDFIRLLPSSLACFSVASTYARASILVTGAEAATLTSSDVATALRLNSQAISSGASFTSFLAFSFTFWRMRR